MKLTLNSRLRDIYLNPVGRDIADKLLLQMGKFPRLIDNPITGGLRLKAVKRLIGKKIGAGFFDAVLELLNSENDAPAAGPAETTARTWWKEAVFYQIYPKSFAKGGLHGILSKLDYLRDLGIDAVWLCPVYDSPNDDNGYDIRDYYKILPEFGDMEVMDSLIAAIHERGMKVVMDLVVNHTSDEHPWFQSALRDENSSFRDFYFFRKSKNNNPPNNWTSFFSGSAWNYYPDQDVWALHLFSKKQMDLNWENPALREEIYKMVRWWLEKGIDGFRLDVINLISKSENLPDGDPLIGALMGITGIERYYYGPRLHEYLCELRAKSFAPYGAFSVGECPGVGIQQGRLLTDNYRKELDLIFSFDHLETPGHSKFDDYRYDLSYLKRFYMEHLNADKGYGWNTLFFNNHDNPRMVSKIDPSGEYTAPLAKMLAVLQLTLRGTPFIYQGDEIGACNEPFTSMDELEDVESLNLYAELIKTMPPDKAFARVLAGTRDHARAPLPWEEIDCQSEDKDSVLNFYRRLIALRKSSPALVYGALEFINPKDKTLLKYTRSLSGDCFYIEANLSAKERRSKSLSNAKLLICNYSEPLPAVLRPYEARVYK